MDENGGPPQGNGGGQQQGNGGGRFGNRGGGFGQVRDARTGGNQKMPFPNYLATHNYPGPWSGDPQSGSLYQALKRKQDKSMGSINGQLEYQYLNHPVTLLHQKIEASAASQLTAERQFAAKEASESRDRLKRAFRAQSEPEAVDATEAAAHPPRPSKSNDFESGNVAFMGAQDNDKPRWYYWMSMMAPFVYYKQNAAHLLDFDIENEQARAFAVAVSFILQTMSNLEIGSKKKKTDDGLSSLEFNYAGKVVPRIRFFVEVVLVEKAGGFAKYLKRDPPDLEAGRFPAPQPSVMHQIYRHENIVGFRFHWVIFDKTLHPATMLKAQIHTNKFEKNAIDYDELTDLLDHHVQNRGFHEYVKKKREDVQKNIEQEKQKQEKERLKKERQEQAKKARAERQAQAAAAGVAIDDEDSEEEDDDFDPDGADPGAAVPAGVPRIGGRAAAAAAGGEAPVEEDPDAIGPSDGPVGTGAHPMQRAIHAAEAVAARAQTSDVEEEEEEERGREEEGDGEEVGPPGTPPPDGGGGGDPDDGDDEDQDESEGDDEDEDESDEMSVGDPLDEEEEARRAKRELDKRGGNNDGTEARISSKKKGLDIFGSGDGTSVRKKAGSASIRLKMADTSSEPTPVTYYRVVQDIIQMSTMVWHVYNQAGCTALSRAYKRGIYETGDGSILKSTDYDLHHSASPLFYLWTFSFKTSVEVAIRHIPGQRIGEVGKILAEQADQNQYQTPQGYFSFPFPDLVYEYSPVDARPEFLAEYRLPCGSSQVSRTLDMLEDRIAQHVNNLAMLSNNGADTSRYANHPTRVFEDPMGDMLASDQSEEEEHAKEVASQQSQLYADVALDLDAAHHARKRTRTGMILQQGVLNALLRAPDSFARPVSVARHPSAAANSEFTNSEVIRAQMTVSENVPVHGYRGVPITRTGIWGKTSTDRIGSSATPSEDGRKRKSSGDDDEIYGAESNPSERVQDEDIALKRLEELDRARRQHTFSAGARSSVASEGSVKLGELMRDAANHLGSNLFTAKVEAIFESGDPEVRKHLRDVLQCTTSANISRALTEEMRCAMESDKAERKKRSEELKRKTGDAKEEVRAQLSTAIIEGPIAKQRNAMAHIRMRLIRIICTMPFKTEIAHLAEWLNEAGCEWANPIRQPGEADQAYYARIADDVLAAMTFDREEQYRRAQFERLMPMFQNEAAVLTLAMLGDANNKELPDVYRGMMLYKADRSKDNKELADRFVAPRFTTDTSLDRFGNMMAIEMHEISTFLGLSDGLNLLQLSSSARVNALRHDKQIPQNNLFAGPPGIGKSEALKHYGRMNIQAAIVTSDYESRLAACVAKAHDYFQLVCDEGQSWVVDAVEKMSGPAKIERDMRKAHLSRQETSFQRNIKKGQNEEREKQNIAASYIHQVIMNANRVAPTQELSVLDRFRLTLVLPPKRKGDDMQKRVLSSHVEFEDNAKARDAYYMTKKDEHYVVGMGVAMQNCWALPQTNTELLAVYLGEFERELTSHINYRVASARATERAFNDAEAYVWMRLHDKYFRSELSPMIRWSRDPKTGAVDGKSIAGVDDFHPLSLVDYFSPGLCVTTSEALWAMTNYFGERYPLVFYEVLLVIAHEVFGFTREYFLPAYQKYKIKLPDVEQRARDRGLATSPYEHCSFLAQFRKFEHKLRDVVVSSGKMPNFAQTYQVGVSNTQARQQSNDATNKDVRLPGARDEDEEAEEDNDAKDQHRAKKKRKKPIYVPSVLVYTHGVQKFWDEARNACKKYFPQLDAHTLLLIVQFTLDSSLQAPWFEYTEQPYSDTIKPMGVEMVNGEVVLDRCGAVKGLVCKPVTAFEFSRGVGGPFSADRSCVKMAVDFFMRPWHEILYLCLTSFETEHTRTFDTVLPLQHRKYPDLLHRWSVRKNPHHTIVVEAARTVPNRVSAVLHPGSYQDFTHQIMAWSTPHDRNSASMSSGSVGAHGEGGAMLNGSGDVEKQAFVRHLISIRYSPYSYDVLVASNPVASKKKQLVDWTAEPNPHKRMLIVAEHQGDAPGNTELAIRWMRNNWEFFQRNRFKTIQYPEYIIEELDNKRNRRKAVEFAENEHRVSSLLGNREAALPGHGGAAKRPLEPKQVTELRKWLEEQQFVDPQDLAGRDQVIATLDVWLRTVIDPRIPPPGHVSAEEWKKMVESYKDQVRFQTLPKLNEFFVTMFWTMRVHLHRKEKYQTRRKTLAEYIKKTRSSSQAPSQDELDRHIPARSSPSNAARQEQQQDSSILASDDSVDYTSLVQKSNGDVRKLLEDAANAKKRKEATTTGASASPAPVGATAPRKRKLVLATDLPPLSKTVVPERKMSARAAAAMESAVMAAAPSSKNSREEEEKKEHALRAARFDQEEDQEEQRQQHEEASHSAEEEEEDDDDEEPPTKSSRQEGRCDPHPPSASAHGDAEDSEYQQLMAWMEGK